MENCPGDDSSLSLKRLSTRTPLSPGLASTLTARLSRHLSLSAKIYIQIYSNVLKRTSHDFRFTPRSLSQKNQLSVGSHSLKTFVRCEHGVLHIIVY